MQRADAMARIYQPLQSTGATLTKWHTVGWLLNQDLLPGSQRAIFWLCPHLVGGAREPLWGLWHKISWSVGSWGLCPYALSTSQLPPPPRPSHWGLGFNIYTFGRGHKNVVHGTIKCMGRGGQPTVSYLAFRQLQYLLVLVSTRNCRSGVAYT